MAYLNWRLNDVQSWNGVSESIPPGSDYLLRVAEVAQTQSSKGNPQMEVTFEVADGALAGRRVKMWYSGADKARGRAKNFIEACGLSLDQQGGLDDQALLGRIIVADAVNNSYDKPDPVTGQVVTKTNIRIENERLYQTQQAQAPQGFVAQGAPVTQQQMYSPPPQGAPAPMPAPAGRPNFPPNAQRGAPGLTRV
jgi:hypothetical protein